VGSRCHAIVSNGHRWAIFQGFLTKARFFFRAGLVPDIRRVNGCITGEIFPEMGGCKSGTQGAPDALIVYVEFALCILGKFSVWKGHEMLY
jgi:hypothetical protein